MNIYVTRMFLNIRKSNSFRSRTFLFYSIYNFSEILLLDLENIY